MREFLGLVTAAPVILFTLGAYAAQFQVSPAGTAGGNGSSGAPWDLATAFAQPAAVHPGDTIWLRGGTYTLTGSLSSTLTGDSGRPIIVRQYPGERAVIDEGPGADHRIHIQGAYTWYWGFEITSSAPDRWTDSTGSNATVDRGWGWDIYTPGIKCINMVFHELCQGPGNWSGGREAEIYGCLIYYNGWDAPDRGHGHGIYSQNQTGTKRLADNILFGQYSHGFHCYTEGGFIDSFYLEGNISFNNGVISTISGATRNILIGGAKIAQHPRVLNNYLYFTPGLGGGTALDLGYGADVANPVVQGNYCVSGGLACNFVSTTASPVFTGNTFYGPVSGFTAGNYPGNTYLGATRPTGARVFVRPNQYEPGRAHICVFNWDNADTVKVDVSAVGLAAGSAYQVRDAQNYFGAPVLSGTYTGDSLRLPMNLTQAATVTGTPARVFSHTPKEFNVLVLLGSGGSSVENRNRGAVNTGKYIDFKVVIASSKVLFSTSSELPRPAEIHIYGVTGNLVKALSFKGLEATWDGKDRHGAPVAEGIYFARLVAGGSQMIKRLVWVR